MDSVAVAIVVVGFGVVGEVIPVVGPKPRTEGFRELFENFLVELKYKPSYLGWVSVHV